ncbi:hypothetical protein RB628_00915 [Streptomyces sp. ADMS]|uniref:hypothetical protein n=1 Tax=Streptomyces sp. ADMS TaxID=3071415 RepID=UPI00296E50DC|nr:hypothetical protein [Streptomyces sp. ADMS]MDW4903940.1 hypothetical protein [Streptomyces sp. ADMS]
MSGRRVDLRNISERISIIRHGLRALLATRNEPYVTLMVNPAAGDGKVQALYRSWGYGDIGQSQPSPASPVLTVMTRDTRWP